MFQFNKRERLPNKETQETLTQKLGAGVHTKIDEALQETMNASFTKKAQTDIFDALARLGEPGITMPIPATTASNLTAQDLVDAMQKIDASTINTTYSKKPILDDVAVSKIRDEIMEQVVNSTKDSIKELTVKYKNALEVVQLQREKIEVMSQLQHGDLSGLFDIVKAMQVKFQHMEDIEKRIEDARIRLATVESEVKRHEDYLREVLEVVAAFKNKSLVYNIPTENDIKYEDIKEAYKSFSKLGSNPRVEVPKSALGLSFGGGDSKLPMTMLPDGKLVDQDGKKYVCAIDGRIIPEVKTE